MISLSVLIPFYDDPLEALELVHLTRIQLHSPENIEWILLGVKPLRKALGSTRQSLPEKTRLILCDSYRGLPHVKNLGLQASLGEMVLFLFPGLIPDPGAIEHMVSQLRAHPEWGAVAGRWNNSHGEVEKGYNIRKFPTYAALLWDVFFINKLFPYNRSTRQHKMHDFDHNTLCQADQANDCAFMARRQWLLDLGGFDESYAFGWFDQLEICRKLRQARHPVFFDPEAVFVSTDRGTLLSRILLDHYADFYADEVRFVEKEFGVRHARFFRISLVVGMMIRLTFAFLFPRRVRTGLLKRFHSYVDDKHIQQMRASYSSLLRALIAPKFEGRRVH